MVAEGDDGSCSRARSVVPFLLRRTEVEFHVERVSAGVRQRMSEISLQVEPGLLGSLLERLFLSLVHDSVVVFLQPLREVV